MIPILNRQNFATEFRLTDSGPEAKIDGDWFSVNGTADLITDVRFPIAEYCKCGSGKYKHAIFDGYGIFMDYVCEDCGDAKTAKFRPDIHEKYETEEPIETGDE